MSENIWDSVLTAINKKIPDLSFNKWFTPTSLLSWDGSTLKIQAPDIVFEDFILNNYRNELEESLDEVGLTEYSLVFEFSSESSSLSDEPAVVNHPSSATAQPAIAVALARTPSRQFFSTTSASSPRMAETDFPETLLNQECTFDNFVVGSSNQFAHAAAMAVADSPSKAYNPLFIYGGVGLGKTHLMCAIGHRIREKHPHLWICYISAERFLNDMISAIRLHKTIDFRRRYRSIDILLIDDIQFIAGKEGTQEEFFHTFNELHAGQKQIVISADCAPKDIPTLEERLHSRFEWGLITEITPPNSETKVAILQKKAESLKIKLPDDVAKFIAEKIKSNIRQLEGALIRLEALSSMMGYPIDLELARQAINQIVDEYEPPVTIEKIQQVVAKHYKLKVSELISKKQTKEIVFPRQVAMYLCETLTGEPQEEIAAKFCKKDHTTVIHSVKKIQALYEEKRDNFHTVINSLIASCK